MMVPSPLHNLKRIKDLTGTYLGGPELVERPQVAHVGVEVQRESRPHDQHAVLRGHLQSALWNVSACGMG